MEGRLDENQWAGRPWAARALRVVVFAAPFVLSVAAAWTLSRFVPLAATVPLGIVRWLLIAALSTVVLMLADRLARRLLPLAALLGLTLAFPDQAPSRFRIAMRTGTTAQLRRRIEDARAGMRTDTPAAAAEKLLELVAALSLHDRLTRGHSERVRAYTHLIGEELGLSPRELDRLRWSGLLHDVGKMLVPGEILNKPSRLTAEEREIIERHPEYGRALVAPLVDWLGEAARAVWEHHERWDGGGYPSGLAGNDIAYAARIVSVADAYDVMTSARSYKKPISPNAARAELTRCSGTQFDPHVVRAFLSVSLGRLRLVTGPLSFVTHLGFLPQALVGAGTSGATAAAAMVGIGAAGLGVGLAEAAPIAAQSRPPAVEYDRPDAVGPGSGGIPAVTAAGGELPVVVGGDIPAAQPPSSTTPAAGTGAGPDASGREPATPPTTRPATPLPTTTNGPQPSTTIGRGTSPGTTTPGQPATTVPPDTRPPETRPPETVAPTTTRPTTTTSTIAPIETHPPQTVPPPVAELLNLGQGLSWHLVSPAPGDITSRPVLPLEARAPTRLLLPNYDTDRDSAAGLLLQRNTSGGNPESADRVQRFQWTSATALRIDGHVTGRVYAAARDMRAADMQVRARLFICTANASCTPVAAHSVRFRSSILGHVAVPFDLGDIDVVVPAGGAFDLRIDTPASSDRDLWLAYDTVLQPGRVMISP